MKTKLLFVCTQGQDRSPAAASLFTNSKTYEAKYTGTSPMAEIKVNRQAIEWADMIFCMEHEHKTFLLENFGQELISKPEIVVLDIENEFCRNDAELRALLKEGLGEWL